MVKRATKFHEEEDNYKANPWYPKPGDLLVHSDLVGFNSDFGWYPGHPCFMGRFLLVIESGSERFRYFDLDKCEVVQDENITLLPWYKVMSS